MIREDARRCSLTDRHAHRVNVHRGAVRIRGIRLRGRSHGEALWSCPRSRSRVFSSAVNCAIGAPTGDPPVHGHVCTELRGSTKRNGRRHGIYLHERQSAPAAAPTT